jgi:hypothetical protein
VRANVFDGDITIKHLLTNEVIVDFDVLGPSMINRVRSKVRTPMLSHQRQGVEIPRSLKSILNQNRSVVARAMARYSASVLERPTTDCFLAVQEMREEPKTIPILVVKRWSSGLPAQSESQKA